MTDNRRTIATKLPMIFLIVFSSFLPIARDSTDAEPTPPELDAKPLDKVKEPKERRKGRELER